MIRDQIVRERVALRNGVIVRTSSGEPAKLHTDPDGYKRITIGYFGKFYGFAAHRLIWFLHYGAWPTQTIDHINHDRADNRIENLRDVSFAENVRHRAFRPNAGVYFDNRRGTWRACHFKDGRQIHLGCFTKEEDALAARRAATGVAATAPTNAATLTPVRQT